jgi:hypothetical protein
MGQALRTVGVITLNDGVNLFIDRLDEHPRPYKGVFDPTVYFSAGTGCVFGFAVKLFGVNCYTPGRLKSTRSPRLQFLATAGRPKRRQAPGYLLIAPAG